MPVMDVWSSRRLYDVTLFVVFQIQAYMLIAFEKDLKIHWQQMLSSVETVAMEFFCIYVSKNQPI